MGLQCTFSSWLDMELLQVLCAYIIGCRAGYSLEVHDLENRLDSESEHL